MLAGDIQVGQKILLDVGYGYQMDDQWCEVLSVYDQDNSLFPSDNGDVHVYFEVITPEGTKFLTHDFHPHSDIKTKGPPGLP